MAGQWVYSIPNPQGNQLSVENIFWNASILHAVDMTQPTQPTLSEQDENAWKVGSGQDLGVGHSVLPGHAKDTADASKHVHSAQTAQAGR